MKKKITLLLATVFISSCVQENKPLVITPTAKQTSSPIPQESIKPTVQTSTTPVPILSPTVSTSTATPTPIPTPTSISADIKSYATVNGYVYDESGSLLNDAKVEIKSLESSVNFSGEAKTIGGSYVFRNVPVGIRLEIKASNGSDWNERKLTYVAKSNSTGDSLANVLNFGDISLSDDTINKQNYDFLTKALEVTSVSPVREGIVKHYGFKLKFTFNKSVKKELLERYFVLRYLKEVPPTNVTLGDGTSSTSNTDGPPLILGLSQVIIDKYTSTRKFDWDTPPYDPLGKEFTFSLLDGYGLPVSNNRRVVYGVSLRGIESDVKITDRNDNYPLKIGEFYNNFGRAKNYVFYVDADKIEPYLDYVKLVKNSSNCIIRVVFSEPMTLQGAENKEIFDISNYTIYKNNSVIKLNNPILVVTNPDSIEIRTDTSTFSDGDTIKVELNQNIKDPSGNFISKGLTLGEKDYIRESKYTP
ncbi:MAG: hypothetical protein AABZ74_14785 [Cyanobacteriota bacterium]